MPTLAKKLNIRINILAHVKYVWRKCYWTYYKLRTYLALTPRERYIQHQMARNYAHLQIRDEVKSIVATVKEYAMSVYGERWNYYSDALRRENIFVFQNAVSGLQGKGCDSVSYLEIGSAQGLSMCLVGSLLNAAFQDVKLVSVDPYYDSGYREGIRGIYQVEHDVTINKETMTQARSLYELCGLKVRLIEAQSNEGLTLLLFEQAHFDLIYIDGSHEGLQPAVDFGLSRPLLKSGGILVLDDYHWVDVAPIKMLCDAHADKIAESWKMAAYRLP